MQGGEGIPQNLKNVSMSKEKIEKSKTKINQKKATTLRRKMQMERIKNFFSDDSGNATEYGLIIALVSVAIIAGATLLGGGLGTMFSNVGTALSEKAADMPAL
jgi:pilus assembly protein Flp/PilA